MTFTRVAKMIDKNERCPCCVDPLGGVRSALATVAALRTLPAEVAGEAALSATLAEVKARGADLLAAVAFPEAAAGLDDLLARFDESVGCFEAECRSRPLGGDVGRKLSSLCQAFRALGEAVGDMTDLSPRRWSQKGKAAPKSGPFVCGQTFS